MNEITNTIINFFQETLNNDILTIIIIALFPIIELRGAIPVAFKLEMPWYSAMFFSWLGSSLVVPILLLLLMPILNAMKKLKGFKHLAHAVEGVFEGKAAKIKTKAAEAESQKKALWKKLIGVYAFVAIPLPLTGVWTGSAVAVFLGLSFWQALPVVLLGNLTAGIIMTVLSVCFKAYVDTILSVFLIIVLVVVAFYIIMLVIKMVKNKKNAGSVDSVENVVSDATTDENAEAVEPTSSIDSMDNTETVDEAENSTMDEDKQESEDTNSDT